jgi:hypothetical protein
LFLSFGVDLLHCRAPICERARLFSLHLRAMVGKQSDALAQLLGRLLVTVRAYDLEQVIVDQ